MTLDELIDDFRRDPHPEKEIAVWEQIARTYKLFLVHNSIDDLATKHDVFSVLLMASLGMQNWSSIERLTREQIRHLVLNYQGV